MLPAVLGCQGGKTETEILWDTWGVPHIYGANDVELFRGFGFAQMESHGNLLLKLYGQARGRAAEYWGERHLAEDRYVRTMGIPARAAAWYDAQDPAFRANLDAFADGVNRYAREHPDQLADSLEVVLPITATDVLSHTQRVIHFTFVHGQDRIFDMVSSPPGSNTWAIAPSRSASGHAMLLANPHLPWADFMLFYESQWEGPGVSIYGATLVGFPVPAIAFNDRLGWSHTVNTYDGTDLYRLTPVEGGYRWDGGVKAFDSATEVIKVRTASGFRDDTLVIRSSVHGPVVQDSGGAVVAARVAGIDQPGMLAQWWAMGRSKDLAEFEAALRTLQVPMFNVMYADQAGHILYLFGGRVPVRSCCDFAHWSGVVPGDSSGNLWTGTLDYDQLPRLLDPATGWLQNANDPPWTSTVPALLDPAKFPAWVSPTGMHFRAIRSARMLAEDSSITFDELVAYKHDTRMELADRVLDELVDAARKSGRPLAGRAADVLVAWDRKSQAESRGAVLFSYWAQMLMGGGKSPFAAEWRIDSALATPHGLADKRAAVAVLEAAAGAVEKAHGALDVPWGDVMRIRYAGKDEPGNGAPGDPQGVFRVSMFVPARDGKFSLVHGDTYYAAVEFGPTVRAKVLLSYGNSSQQGSSHMGDQIPLYVRQEMRDAWLTKREVEANLEKREVFR